MKIAKDLDYYLSLPYGFEMEFDGKSTYFARVVELPGCTAQADSAEDAARLVDEAMARWIEIALKDGRPIPEPLLEYDACGGQFMVWLPKSLRRELVVAAELDGVSLNQYIIAELARCVGRVQPQLLNLR